MRVVIYAFRSPGSGAVYIGKHECNPEGWPRRGNGKLPDGYPGSGLAVANFHRRHGDKVEWRTLAIVAVGDWSRAERRAVDLARAIFGRRCVNIADGGAGFTSDQAKRLWEDPAYVAAKSAAATATLTQRWKDPAYVAAKRAAAEAQWSDPGGREKISATERKRAVVKALWGDARYAAKVRATRKAQAATPEGSAQLARATAAASTPEATAKKVRTRRRNDGWRRWAEDNPQLFDAPTH